MNESFEVEDDYEIVNIKTRYVYMGDPENIIDYINDLLEFIDRVKSNTNIEPEFINFKSPTLFMFFIVLYHAKYGKYPTIRYAYKINNKYRLSFPIDMNNIYKVWRKNHNTPKEEEKNDDICPFYKKPFWCSLTGFGCAEYTAKNYRRCYGYKEVMKRNGQP